MAIYKTHMVQLMFLSVCTHIFVTTASEQQLSVTELFDNVQKAYNRQMWSKCQDYASQTAKQFSNYKEKVASCQIQCNSISFSNLMDSEFVEASDNVLLSHLKASSCVQTCLGEQDITEIIAPKMLRKLDKFVHYDFLQMCAFKAGNTEMASKAATTYYFRNPEDKSAANNFAFYSRQSPNDDSDHLVNMEPMEQQTLFETGRTAYTLDNWELVVASMEGALHEYVSYVAKCDAVCQYTAASPDALTGLNHVVAAVGVEYARCRQGCEERASLGGGDKTRQDMLGLMLHYLQFTYYKGDQPALTAEYVASYLLLHPDDDTMLHNKKFYMSQYPLKDAQFAPKPLVLKLLKRREWIAKVLETAQGLDLSSGAAPAEAEVASPVHELPAYTREELEAMVNKDLIKQLKSEGIDVPYTEVELEAPQRVVMDNVLSQEQCQMLVELGEAGATVGDGYDVKNGATSPHTTREKFAGLSLDKAARMARSGAVKPEAARLYLESSELSRDYAARYFKVKTPLYFDYTHLVCRTAIGDRQKDRKDPSHPIHSDNCQIMPDGTCLKSPEVAYVQRDYSALLYLNDDFEGGKFIFAHNNQSDHKLVTPICGRLVAFNASIFHGVKAVTKGKRCALALWFTLDKRYDEVSHQTARKELEDIGLKLPSQNYNAHLLHTEL